MLLKRTPVVLATAALPVLLLLAGCAAQGTATATSKPSCCAKMATGGSCCAEMAAGDHKNCGCCHGGCGDSAGMMCSPAAK